MLCWVRTHEKKELIEAVNGQFSVMFANTFNSFKRKVRENDYLVISSILANDREIVEKIQRLTHFFSKNIFVLYDSYNTSEKGTVDLPYIAAELWNEPNVISTWFRGVEIVNNFLGIIPDLKEYDYNMATQIINAS
jgi:hypothetical protein